MIWLTFSAMIRYPNLNLLILQVHQNIWKFDYEIKQVSWSLPNCSIELWTISTLLIVHKPIDLNEAYKKNIVETKIIWRRFIRFEGNSLVKTSCSKYIQNSYSSCDFVIFFPFLVPLLNAMSVTYLCMTFIFFQFVHKKWFVAWKLMNALIPYVDPSKISKSKKFMQTNA